MATFPRTARSGADAWRDPGGHWHVIPAGHGVLREHEAWHISREPCILCGAISWTAATHHRTSSGLPLSPCYRAARPARAASA